MQTGELSGPGGLWASVRRWIHPGASIANGPGRFMRDGVWLAIGHGLTVLAGIVSIRLFTELAPPAVFGGANLLLGVLTLGMNAIVAPVTQTHVRHHMGYADAGEVHPYMRAMMRFALSGGLLVAIPAAALLLIAPSLRAGGGVGVVAALVAWVLVTAARNILINKVHAERQHRRYAFWISSEAILVMVCTALLLAVWPSVEGFVVGQLLGTLLGMLMWFDRRKSAAVSSASPRALDDVGDVATRAWRQIVSYGLPFLPFALLVWISNQADRYLLVTYLDSAAVGQYVAAFGIAMRIPTLFGSLLSDLCRPALFEAESRGDKARSRKVFQTWLFAAFVGVLVMLLCLWLTADLIVGVMLSAPYRPGAQEIMLWIACGYGFTTMAMVIENRILSGGKSRVLIWPKSMAAVGNVGFALMLVPAWGVIGAAMANAAGQLLQLVVTALVLMFRTESRLGSTVAMEARGV